MGTLRGDYHQRPTRPASPKPIVTAELLDKVLDALGKEEGGDEILDVVADAIEGIPGAESISSAQVENLQALEGQNIKELVENPEKAAEVIRRMASKPIVNDGQRVGRNEDCPCGSGRKFKKCCGK